MGGIKYIVPIGTFIIAIYMTCEDKDYLFSKLVQYGVFLICIATVLSVFQISKGNINTKGEFSQMLQDGYYLGEKNIGGGVIGTAIAGPLINLIGGTGAVILCIGIAILLIVFMFGIQPAEIVANFMDDARERREEKQSRRKQTRDRSTSRRSRKVEEIEEEYDEEDDDERPTKKAVRETKKERRLREKEEQRRQAEELAEQLTININDGTDEDKDKKKKKYNHDKDNLIPFNINKGKNKEDEPKEEHNPDVIDANLFKTEQETKEEKVKEVLQLEHTMTVEDENYEFPPIQLLSEGEKKVNKGGKKAVTDTATRLQKTLYSFGVSAKVENVSVGPAITRYELKPAEGVRVNKIANLADDIALNLAAETIRIEAPIPGKQAVGIEVPNK